MAETERIIPKVHPPFTLTESVGFAFAGCALYVFGTLAHYTAKLKNLVKQAEKRPDLIKRYECRPSLDIHVFYPPSYDQIAGPDKQKLPTLLTVHGGGFVIGNPEDSDAWNYDFVRLKRPTLVVSLNYRKAPFFPFPTAIHDLEALIHAVLADKSLPIDPDQVAIAGWSAGGNLTISVASLASLQGRLRAVIPIYPVTDFSTPTSQKLLQRQYKPGMKGYRGKQKDFLATFASTFNWSYLPSGAKTDDLVAPLLSPTYLPKESLPPHVFILAAELDMLSYEAWGLACKLAGRAMPSMTKSGSSEIHPPGKMILDDERFSFETRTETSSYKWLLVPDVIHAFDMDAVRFFKDDELFADCNIKRHICMEMMNDWLFSGPFHA